MLAAFGVRALAEVRLDRTASVVLLPVRHPLVGDAEHRLVPGNPLLAPRRHAAILRGRYPDAGQVTNPLAAAHELYRICLSDALELCELLAQERDPRFPRAASRWLARFAADASLEDVQLAAAALTHLAADPNSNWPDSR
jgi:hypothetical protein